MADTESIRQPASLRLHEYPPQTTTERDPANSAECAKFEGSFAPRGRPKLHRQIWYRRREYFWGGWDDPSIWRSAVSFQSHLILSGSCAYSSKLNNVVVG
jgi:hypothetical protein